MSSIHHYPPSFHEKLYLNENWTLNPSLLEPIREVLAAAPLKFAAHHHVRDRVIEQVAERVLADPEGVRRLPVGVVVVLARVADRAA